MIKTGGSLPCFYSTVVSRTSVATNNSKEKWSIYHNVLRRPCLSLVSSREVVIRHEITVPNNFIVFILKQDMLEEPLKKCYFKQM